MRLRIQTYHPLPDIKAWFIPDVQSAPESVYDLKEALCLRFQALKARNLSGEDIILLLDGFELLNDSPFSAVRDGDLICVKLSPLAQVENVEINPVVGESDVTRQRKRKRSPSTMLRIPSRSVRAPTVLPSLKHQTPKLVEHSEGSGSESDTSSTSSVTSSSSSSSTPSCSSSSSPSSSSSSSSSPPKPITSKPTNQLAGSKKPVDNMTVTSSASRIVPLVPPGLGKPSTHSRNKRRRLKRDYKKEAMSATLSVDTPGPPKGSSHTNQLPLGQRKSKPGPSSLPNPTQRDREGPAADIAYTLNHTSGMNAQCGDMLPKNAPNEHISDSYIIPNQVMMGSLRNKNKKKGFKQSMANPIPQKIVFTTTTTPESGSQRPPFSSTQDGLMDEPSSTSSTTTIQPRLIPPSEIQELGQLPPNMFVTSVDVESGMLNEHLPCPKKKGKKKKKALNGGGCCYPATTDWHDSSQMEESMITTQVREDGQFDDADDGSLILPYFDTDVQTTTTTTTQTSSSSVGTTSGASRSFDWDRAEKLWDECAALEKLEQLVVGCLVGWKGLTINPQTSSPEILLTVARVVNVTPKSAQNIVIRYLQRPGVSQAALAFGLCGAAGFDHEEQVENDEETLEWADFLENQWRVINL